MKVYGMLPESIAPPANAPTGLTIDETNKTASSLTAFWDPGLDVTSWTVYVNGTPFGPALSPTVLIFDLIPLTPYSVQVQAHNAGGSSPLSETVVGVTAANSAPDWALGQQDLTVGVAYNLAFSSVCSDRDGHSLTYSQVSGTLPPGIQVNSNQNGLTGTPTTGGSYSATFRANDGYGTTDETISFVVATVADTLDPTIPVLSGVVAGDTVTLTWTASTDASGILQYRVRQDDVALTPHVPHPTLTRIVSGLVNGTYVFEVRAEDNAGNISADSNPYTAIINVAPLAPGVPTYNAIVVISSSQLNSTWTAATSGPAPTRYQLDRSLTGANAQNPAAAGWTNVLDDSAPPLALSLNDTGLPANTQQFYRLRAFNGVTPSAYATRNATTSQTSGFVWPTAKHGGANAPSWYTGPGSISNHNTNMPLWEDLVGRRADLYVEWTGSQGASTWAEFDQGGTVKFQDALDSPAIPNDCAIVHVWPLMSRTEENNNNKFEQTASGVFESHWNTAMDNMKQRVQNSGRPLNTIIFDLAHEMSGNWYAWSLIDGAAKIQAFKDAWAYAVGKIRSRFPGAIIIFRPARRQGGATRTITLAQMYPGDSVVDIIGRSIHDKNEAVNRNQPSTWDAHVNSPPGDKNIGLQEVADLCRARGKKMGFTEWSSAIYNCPGDDYPNPNGPINGTSYFYEKMWDFMNDNADIMICDGHFSTGCTRLWGTRPDGVTPPDSQVSERHLAGKAAYSSPSRWGQ